jgi:hypothetical protein
VLRTKRRSRRHRESEIEQNRIEVLGRPRAARHRQRARTVDRMPATPVANVA